MYWQLSKNNNNNNKQRQKALKTFSNSFFQKLEPLLSVAVLSIKSGPQRCCMISFPLLFEQFVILWHQCQVAQQRQGFFFLYTLYFPQFQIFLCDNAPKSEPHIFFKQYTNKPHLALPKLGQKKHQTNKLLLVFRLICSLLDPIFSHAALHSVSGVLMFCITLKGFLSPPGLQLTPLLIGICPFSISIAANH